MKKPSKGQRSTEKGVLLKGTQDFRLKYTHMHEIILIGYYNSNFHGYKDTRVSSLVSAMGLGSRVVS